jgi:hypothetical protein
VELNIVDRASDSTIGRTLKRTSLSPISNSNGSFRRRPTAHRCGCGLRRPRRPHRRSGPDRSTSCIMANLFLGCHRPLGLDEHAGAHPKSWARHWGPSHGGRHYPRLSVLISRNAQGTRGNDLFSRLLADRPPIRASVSAHGGSRDGKVVRERVLSLILYLFVNSADSCWHGAVAGGSLSPWS